LTILLQNDEECDATKAKFLFLSMAPKKQPSYFLMTIINSRDLCHTTCKELLIFLSLNKKLFMKKNIGSTDKLLRVLVAAFFAVLFFTGSVTGIAGIVLLLSGGILIVTSFISFCPLYTLFGITTCENNKTE
jgi:hypothetical protein